MPKIKEASGFSVRTLALSIAAAELGQSLLSAGNGSPVRVRLLLGIPAALALVVFSLLAEVNRARMERSGFVARCLCGVFALWYLAEGVRTAAQLQQVCWEQFSSMAFVGLLPFFLWAGWSLESGTFNRVASILWWFAGAGAVVCILGLAGQFRWQNLIAQEAFADPLQDIVLYPEYFSAPLLMPESKQSRPAHRAWVLLPLLSLGISSGYALGTALLFGAQPAKSAVGYSGYELLRAWNFGGISRFDAAFLLVWLAAAMFRLCFLLHAARLLFVRLLPPSGAAADGEVAE